MSFKHSVKLRSSVLIIIYIHFDEIITGQSIMFYLLGLQNIFL